MTLPNPFSDPRLLPDFDPACLPTCDGDALPHRESKDPHDQCMIEFAAAYYAMNRAQALFERAQQLDDGAAMKAADEQRRAACRARDALEDRLALIFFFAQPIMRGEWYVDLHFRLREVSIRPRVHVRQFVAEITF
jgi:hypothetical protein